MTFSTETPAFGPVSVVETKLSVSRSTAYSLLLSGEIESVKIGKSRRVVLDSLDRYIDRLRGIDAEAVA